MEAIFSAILGELATRSLFFLIDKYLKSAPTKEDKVKRVQWMLLRVRLTVEEAEGRRITNQTMLQQLDTLRRVMYKSYYILDSFVQSLPEETNNFHGVSFPLSLSTSSPPKRVCFSAGGKYGAQKIQQVLDNLEITIAGMSEFVVFLSNCPPMFRQPYSTYLFMEKCMFGRQMEMELAITFLLHEEPPGDCNFGVLPIVGPGKVGKTTLVEHVCCHEKVRDHFSHIIFLSDNDFQEEKQCKLRDISRIRHQHCAPSEEKILVVIELVGNINESAWRRLLSASQCSIPRGSKVIITSQSENIIKFGTTQALNLKFLSRDAYWYYFKALVFRSADPEEQPKLASIAMAIFDEYFDQEVYKAFAGPFIYLNKTAASLKSNVNVQNWNRILSCFKDNRRQNDPESRKGLSDFRMNSNHIFLRRVASSTEYCVVHNHDRTKLTKEEAPKIALHDILNGIRNVRPNGKFDIIVWESHLPPYYKYIYSCQIIELDCKVTRNKKGQKRRTLS